MVYSSFYGGVVIMLRDIRSNRLRIFFNGENTIQRVEFYGEKGEVLTVMFKTWGIYTPNNPTPIRLEVDCGGFVQSVDEFGEVTFATCFLVKQEGALVQPELEAEVTAFVLRNQSFGIEMKDDEGLVTLNISQVLKMRGIQDTNGFYFHEWTFDYPIILMVDDGQGI